MLNRIICWVYEIWCFGVLYLMCIWFEGVDFFVLGLVFMWFFGKGVLGFVILISFVRVGVFLWIKVFGVIVVIVI